jgi:hypothetical protein
MPAGKVLFDAFDAATLLPTFFLKSSTQRAPGPVAAWLDDGRQRIGLPVRAHLWNQVLLI